MTRLFLIGLAMLTLSACETAKGAGKDLRKVGDTIIDTANDVQKKL